jgi:hypothetical protein
MVCSRTQGTEFAKAFFTPKMYMAAPHMNRHHSIYAHRKNAVLGAMSCMNLSTVYISPCPSAHNSHTQQHYVEVIYIEFHPSVSRQPNSTRGNTFVP